MNFVVRHRWFEIEEGLYVSTHKRYLDVSGPPNVPANASPACGRSPLSRPPDVTSFPAGARTRICAGHWQLAFDREHPLRTPGPGYQCTLFVGTEYFSFVTVKIFHLDHPFLDSHASLYGSGLWSSRSNDHFPRPREQGIHILDRPRRAPTVPGIAVDSDGSE